MSRLAWLGIGSAPPVAAAAALVSLRDVLLNANVALVPVAVVVAVAVGGGREAGAAAAVASALSFDVLHTEPYLRLRITSSDDIETTVLLLVVGLVVGTVAARGRQARTSAEARTGEIRRIYRLANLSAKGEDPADVVMAAQGELAGLLGLRDCRFEASPFASTYERLERGGTVSWQRYRIRSGGLELPEAGAELLSSGEATSSAGSSCTRPRASASRSSSEWSPSLWPTRWVRPSPRLAEERGRSMADVVFVLLALGFFALCVLYIRGIERMLPADDEVSG